VLYWRIRVVPPRSQYLSQLVYPGGEDLVAPGMHVAVILRFTPIPWLTSQRLAAVDGLSRILLPPARSPRSPPLLQHLLRPSAQCMSARSLHGASAYADWEHSIGVAADAWPQA
jgi:hypothetical protein